MKKQLLIAALALCSCGVSFADDSAKTPEIYADLLVRGMSPDANWLASSNDYFSTITLVDRSTGKVYNFFDEEGDYVYSGGLGNFISNNGVAVGTTSPAYDDASYCVDGEWHTLPIRDTDLGVCLSQGITADGSRICGTVGRSSWGLDAEGILQLPVIWPRLEDGTYGEYIELPHPATDITGSTPQYITAVYISEDGKTVAGQIVSGSGMLVMPIVYTEDAEGNWTYNVVMEQELFNPNNVELPEYPGDAPEEPTYQQFMTPEEIAAFESASTDYTEYWNDKPNVFNYMSQASYDAYEAAYEAYMADPYNNPYPYNPADFLNDEEKAMYEADMDDFYANAPDYPQAPMFMTEDELNEYQDAYDEWEDQYYVWAFAMMDYEEALEEMLADAPLFQFNTVALSGNGRYLVQTHEISDWMSGLSITQPYLFDLVENQLYKLEGNKGIYGGYVTNDGAVYGGSPANDIMRNAWVSPTPGAEFVTLEDYVKGFNPELYTWMEENMKHDYMYEGIDPETGEYDILFFEDTFVTGSPIATPDNKYVATWAFNAWDQETVNPDTEMPIFFYSYLLPLDKGEGIGAISLDGANLNVACGKKGVVMIAGKADNMTVYDMNGRVVYTNDAPAARVETGLANGFYVVKVTGADGKTIVRKAAF